MLVLNRKVDGKVVCTLPNGEAMVITVVEIHRTRGEVKLGFHAPDSVKIDRAEVALRRASPELEEVHQQIAALKEKRRLLEDQAAEGQA